MEQLYSILQAYAHDGNLASPGADFEQVGPVKLLVLQGTSFCNINCRYCYLPDRNNTAQMSVETVRAAVSRLREDKLLKGPLLVNWHAGEPLVLAPDFYRVRIKEFAPLEQDGIKVEQSLQTNGVLIDDAFCELFQEFEIAIGVSVDGPAFIHDRSRVTRSGGPTHAKAEAGMAKLRDHNVSFNAICVLTDFSLNYPDEIYEYFRDVKVRALAFNVEEVEGANRTSSFSAHGFADRFRIFLERIWERVENEGGLIQVREFDDMEARILDHRGRRNGQTTPFVNITVAANGDWSTYCPELLGNSFRNYPSFTLGNVHAGGFLAAQQSTLYRKLNGDIVAGVDACHDTCEYFDVCGGGNPSNKVSENATMRSTETLNCINRIKTLGDMMLGRIEERVIAKTDLQRS